MASSKDIWDGVKKVLSTVAPVLGNAIIPGVGGVAGSLLASVLGVDANDPKAIEKAVAVASPEILQKIKELEYTHQEKLLQIASENDKNRMLDIANARNREIEITKVTGKLNYPIYILAGLITLGFFVVMGISMYATLPEDNVQIISILIGTLSTGFGMVLQYFFGSSKTSGDKNDKIANSISPEMLSSILTQINTKKEVKQLEAPKKEIIVEAPVPPDPAPEEASKE